jgi:hypothetical protein
MVHKPKRGRYLELEDVRVSYNHKDDTIHLTSSDPEIPQGSFFLTLNRNTSTEVALRDLLEEHQLIKKSEVMPEVVMSIPSPLPQLVLKSRKPKIQRPLINISGQPGSGKTFAIKTFAELASSIDLKTVILADEWPEHYLNDAVVTDLAKPSEGSLNVFQMGLTNKAITTMLVNMMHYSEEYYSVELRHTLSEIIEFVSGSAQPTLAGVFKATQAVLEKRERELSRGAYAAVASFARALESLDKSNYSYALFGYNNTPVNSSDKHTEIITNFAVGEEDNATGIQRMLNDFFSAYVNSTLINTDLALVDVYFSEYVNESDWTESQRNTKTLVDNFVSLARKINVMTVNTSTQPDDSIPYTEKLSFYGYEDAKTASLLTGEFIWETKIGTEYSEMFHVSNIID